MAKLKLVEEETKVIGTIKIGNQVIGLLVSSESQDIFQAAFSGLLHTPIYVTAIPVIFAFYQSETEIIYERPD